MTLKTIFSGALIGIALTGAINARADAQQVIRFADARSNFFPDTIVTAAVQVVSGIPLQGRLVWEFHVDGAVIDRGETGIVLAAPGVAEAPIPLVIPEGRPDAAVAAGLRVGLSVADRSEMATAEKSLWILGREPWLGRLKWLEQLNILLFDPDETTAPILEEAGIPFRQTRNPDALAGGGYGLLLLAENIDFEEYRGLPEIMLNAAASGLPVICLAPAGGEFDLTGISAAPRSQSLCLSDRTIVRKLDKRLDMEDWGIDGKAVKSTIRICAERDRIPASISPGSDGWPWLEIVFPAKSARLILTGFAIMEKWEETPAARHLFLRLLERAETKHGKE